MTPRTPASITILPPPTTAAVHPWAGIDIFPFDDRGRIVEDWDVLQRVPATSLHENSMF